MLRRRPRRIGRSARRSPSYHEPYMMVGKPPSGRSNGKLGFLGIRVAFVQALMISSWVCGFCTQSVGPESPPSTGGVTTELSIVGMMPLDEPPSPFGPSFTAELSSLHAAVVIAALASAAA